MDKRWSLLVVLLAVSACGAPSAAPETSGRKKPSAKEKLGVTPPETPWADMSYEEKEWYMIGKVMPITEEIFAEFDAKKYPKIGCETCHGADADEVKYRMPSGDIAPMPRPGTTQYEQIRHLSPEMMKFMEEDVTPVVRILLGLPEQDGPAGSAFGCTGCHKVAGE